MRNTWLLPFFLVAYLTLPPAGGAQDSASLAGSVNDLAGAPVGGAVLTLIAADDTAQARSVLTAAGGNYQLVGLRPGTYTLRVDRLGYVAAEVGPLILNSGELRRLDLVLQVDTLELEGVVVRGRRLIASANSSSPIRESLPALWAGRRSRCSRGSPRRTCCVPSRCSRG